MKAKSSMLVRFASQFGRSPEFAVRAPGRVNLIGEHTDYNEGLVLPCAIDRDTQVLAARRSDGRVRVLAADLDEQAEFECASPARRGSWVDYVQAVVFSLAEQKLETPGLDLLIHSEVPREAGLSSSAALGVAVAMAIDAAQDWGLDAMALARIVHRGEREFVGVGCGILDQFASALARRDHVLRIDCRDQTTSCLPLPGELGLLLTDSGVRRALAGDGSGYLARVAECEAALEAAREAQIAAPEATSLRDLRPEQLAALERELDPVLVRRVRHVLLENQRVDSFCAALRSGPDCDLAALGRLLDESHRSLRDDYEVSVPELDLLCELGRELPGVFGSRLTGAGFGGWVLHLVEASAASEIGQRISQAFERRVGRPSAFTLVAPSQGASRLEL